MKEALSTADHKVIDQMVSGMSIEEKIGQVFCINSGEKFPAELSETGKKYSIGGLFFRIQDNARMPRYHGEIIGDCGVTHKMAAYYDSLMRIPMLLWDPSGRISRGENNENS
jgi:hypothetical protein